MFIRSFQIGDRPYNTSLNTLPVINALFSYSVSYLQYLIFSLLIGTGYSQLFMIFNLRRNYFKSICQRISTTNINIIVVINQ